MFRIENPYVGLPDSGARRPKGLERRLTFWPFLSQLGRRSSSRALRKELIVLPPAPSDKHYIV
nr:MAG TPA: hypothetical protein [Caudoviricetes sp.]